ncbi:MAG: ABC transporter permease, partial [Lachnospiraceae bacterium]|nr:ABC transporter permease [Lachnospiraceae bacterium]
DEKGELKENYLVVANYATVAKSFKISPYQVWMSLSEDAGYEDVEAFLENNKVEIESIGILDEDIMRMKNSPMIQITNGMFTLSFIIALILCAIGFLIYWISSIRQRELLFGVYRAMGMSLKNVNGMLINEHIFSTFLSVIAGGVVGMVSTLLFVKLFGIVYLPEKHNLDIYIYFEMGDIVKLSVVIVLMILVCILVLRKLIKSLNITQALKLGEE